MMGILKLIGDTVTFRDEYGDIRSGVAVNIGSDKFFKF